MKFSRILAMGLLCLAANPALALIAADETAPAPGTAMKSITFLIIRDTVTGKQESCTASYLSDNTAITAAHCLHGENGHSLSIRDYFTGATALAVETPSNGQYDVGLVKFPDNTYRGPSYRLDFRDPSRRTLRIMSYGEPFVSEKPVFRSGFPTFSVFNDTMFSVEGRPGTTHGDSGCPLIDEQAQAIVGVNSYSWEEPHTFNDGSVLTAEEIARGESPSYNTRVGTLDSQPAAGDYAMMYHRAIRAGFHLPTIKCRCDVIHKDGSERTSFGAYMVDALIDGSACRMFEYETASGNRNVNCRRVD